MKTGRGERGSSEVSPAQQSPDLFLADPLIIKFRSLTKSAVPIRVHVVHNANFSRLAGIISGVVTSHPMR